MSGEPEPVAVAATTEAVKNNKKYRKPKPWDTDDIEHWKIDEWKADFMKAPLCEESSFATLFPAYREKYLREVWPLVTNELLVRLRTPLAC